MLSDHHFQIPDRVFFTLTALIVFVSASFAFWAWPQLPDRLPIHFSASGRADGYSDSKALTLLFPVIMQLVFILLVSWAYRHPQHFNFPTTRRFSTFTLPVQQALVTLARHMLAILLLITELLMTHIVQGVVLVGFGLPGAPDPAILIFLVVFLFTSIAVYTVWMARIIRRGTTDPQPLRG